MAKLLNGGGAVAVIFWETEVSDAAAVDFAKEFYNAIKNKLGKSTTELSLQSACRLYEYAFGRAKDHLTTNSWLFLDANPQNEVAQKELLHRKEVEDIAFEAAGVPSIYLKCNNTTGRTGRDEDFTELGETRIQEMQKILTKIGWAEMDPADLEIASRYRPLDIIRSDKATQLCIQFLAAEPEHLVRVSVYKEYKKVEKEALKGSTECCPYLSPAVTSDSILGDISNSFKGLGAHILHFSGHSDSGELSLEGGIERWTDGDDETAVHTTDVAPALNLHASTSRLHGMVLNACGTDKVYKQIKGSQGFVISTAAEITPEAALCFSSALYSNIAEGRDLWHSFCKAVVQVHTSGSSEAKNFKLDINKEKLERTIKELKSA
jgi:hypothetical protein